MEWCFMCGVTSFTNVWNHNQRCNDIYTCSSPEVCFLSNCGEWSIRRHWCLIDFSYHAGNRVAKQQPGTYWRHHQVLTSTVWQLSQYTDSIEAGSHVVCFLAEAWDILSIQNIRPALGTVWALVQWMLWILPQHWSSRCLRLITQLSFLLRLQIGAVVTVLPLYVFMVYTGTVLSFTIGLKQWLEYLPGHNSVPQKMRPVWSHGTVFLFSSTALFQNTEWCYLMICIEQECLYTSVHVAFPSM